MNLPYLAAELARRIPEMARDSQLNNETMILQMLQSEQEREIPKEFPLQPEVKLTESSENYEHT